MSYPLRSSNFEDRKRISRRRSLLIVALLVVLVLAIATSPVRRFLFSLAEPIWQVENSVLSSKVFEYFKFKQTLIDERLAMERKLFLAGNLMAENEILKTENESLKDLLGRKDTKLKTVLASILVKPPQTPYDSLVVDIGEGHNIKVGDKVMANGNVYVGEVSEVMSDTSKITLYSTPGRKLSVVLGLDPITVEAVGVGGGNFNIFLPREVEVSEGDVIIIPSITANVFGIVEKVNFKDKDSFQTVLFKSPVNISELSFVEIVI